MVDGMQWAGKQRQFVALVQQITGERRAIASLRAFCQTHGFDFNFIKGFLLSGALEGYVRWEAYGDQNNPAALGWGLTGKGQGLSSGIPGATLAQYLLAGITDLAGLQGRLGDRFQVEFAALHQGGLVSFSPDGPKEVQCQDLAALGVYLQYQATFEAIAQGSPLPTTTPSPLPWLQQQGYIAPQGNGDYRLEGLPALTQLDLTPQVTTLTSDLLLSGQWQQVRFKPYDIHAPVGNVPYGRPTLLSRCMAQVRDIFLNMGFDEMVGQIVDTAFWNFDVLFTPQDHPAREVQDTFYLEAPATLPLPGDRALVEQVRQVQGAAYGGVWTESEASRALLRGHTTTTTARRLYELQGRDGQYFSIDRVFRNETVDRTHLAEFHQIEGVVVGELLSVRTLMGYLHYFYDRLGFKQLKFRPTYNPYTEPSLEVLAYHGPSDQYLEVGNSGLFRQEMLAPLGCGHKATVAWGLGLERIALLLYGPEYGVDKLSDLIGPDIRL